MIKPCYRKTTWERLIPAITSYFLSSVSFWKSFSKLRSTPSLLIAVQSLWDLWPVCSSSSVLSCFNLYLMWFQQPSLIRRYLSELQDCCREQRDSLSCGLLNTVFFWANVELWSLVEITQSTVFIQGFEHRKCMLTCSTINWPHSNLMQQHKILTCNFGLWIFHISWMLKLFPSMKA